VVSAPELKGLQNLYGFREKTLAEVKNGTVKLRFHPYQVHLLTSPRLDQSLKKVEELKKEISDTRERFRNKGNLLYDRGREIEFTSSDTYISNLSLVTLTDGMTDTFGWASWTKPTNRENPAFIEMKFLTFVPEFRRLKVYSATLEDMDVFIWRKGDWEKVGEVRGNKSEVIELDFAERLKTVKMKLLVTRVKPSTKAEIYEVELYEN